MRYDMSNRNMLSSIAEFFLFDIRARSLVMSIALDRINIFKLKKTLQRAHKHVNLNFL